MASDHTRVDTSELKDTLYREIGHKRAENYFNHLQEFLSLTLSKAEFNKSCLQTIGRENVPLHNKLIHAIVQNVSQSKAPPLKKSRKLEKPASGDHPLPQCIKGDAFPKKFSGSPINRKKLRDRSSPLGPLGKSPSVTLEETVSRLQEQQQSASLSSKPLVDDGEEVEQLDGEENLQRWSHISAPPGFSFDKFDAIKPNTACQSSRELPDSVSLWSHLKRKLEPEGLGVSVDCANVLNASVDAYLRRLIEPCLNKTRSRRSRDLCNNGERFSCCVPRSSSMRDFRFAVESNYSLLGVDWPVQLEKISQYSMEE